MKAGNKIPTKRKLVIVNTITLLKKVAADINGKFDGEEMNVDDVYRVYDDMTVGKGRVPVTVEFDRSDLLQFEFPTSVAVGGKIIIPIPKAISNISYDPRLLAVGGGGLGDFSFKYEIYDRTGSTLIKTLTGGESYWTGATAPRTECIYWKDPLRDYVITQAVRIKLITTKVAMGG